MANLRRLGEERKREKSSRTNPWKPLNGLFADDDISFRQADCARRLAGSTQKKPAAFVNIGWFILAQENGFHLADDTSVDFPASPLERRGFASGGQNDKDHLLIRQHFLHPPPFAGQDQVLANRRDNVRGQLADFLCATADDELLRALEGSIEVKATCNPLSIQCQE